MTRTRAPPAVGRARRAMGTSNSQSDDVQCSQSHESVRGSHAIGRGKGKEGPRPGGRAKRAAAWACGRAIDLRYYSIMRMPKYLAWRPTIRYGSLSLFLSSKTKIHLSLSARLHHGIRLYATSLTLVIASFLSLTATPHVLHSLPVSWQQISASWHLLRSD